MYNCVWQLNECKSPHRGISLRNSRVLGIKRITQSLQRGKISHIQMLRDKNGIRLFKRNIIAEDHGQMLCKFWGKTISKLSLLYPAISVSSLNFQQQNLYISWSNKRFIDLRLLAWVVYGIFWWARVCRLECHVASPHPRPLWELHLRRHTCYHTWHRPHSWQHEKKLHSWATPPLQSRCLK